MENKSSNHHLTLPRGKDIPLVALGIFGVGTSGPLIAGSKMPITSLIFWRNLGGTIILLPFALAKNEWFKLENRTAVKRAMLAGILLGFHFIAFFTAMRFTTVATGTALTCLQPIFAAIYVSLMGHSIPRRAWTGMLIAFLSVLLITGIDLHINARYFFGDLAAIAAGALAAGYMLIGSHAQKTIATSTYTVICYFFCAITGLTSSVITGVKVWGFPTRDWVLCALLILGAQIMGHTMFNLTLKRVSPVIVSLIIFFEVPISAIIAAVWLHQKPSAGIIPGLIGLLVGCGIFVTKKEVSVD
jgi:drug/metabolite transporter (DMT)-like permease